MPCLHDQRLVSHTARMKDDGPGYVPVCLEDSLEQGQKIGVEAHLVAIEAPLICSPNPSGLGFCPHLPQCASIGFKIAGQDHPSGWFLDQYSTQINSHWKTN